MMPSGSHLAWYVGRLRAMSSREILHRVGEGIKRQAWRRRKGGWERFDVGDGPVKSSAAFTVPFSAAWPEELLLQARAAATATMTGTLQLLGQPWPASPRALLEPAVWFVDPISGTRWPGAEQYCFDVDFRHQTSRGDVKLVWELNRLQFLHSVAALVLRGDREFGSFTVNVLLSWMAANPPFRGVNWSSGIELALRLVTVMIVVSAAGNSLGAEERRNIRSLVAAHAYWLGRYSSLYSSANNHRVAEGLGLLVAGLLIPDVPGASANVSAGRALLAEAPFSQFYADGTGREQSPTYAAFVLEMICIGIILLRAEGQDFDCNSLRRLIPVCEQLQWMLDADGNAPHVGDDDEGRVIAMSPLRETRYVASVLAGAAGILQRSDLAPPQRDRHLRDLVFGSAENWSATLTGVRNFPDGGYTVIRQATPEGRLLVIFDHGPLGFLSIAAHGHADALSIWIHCDDLPVIVDAGTYLYHAGGAWREYLRSTAAHNTLEIEDQSQSTTSGAFNWRRKAKAWATEYSDGPNWKVAGRHDGYRRQFGIDHERAVTKSGDGIIIEDRLVDAAVPLRVKIRFLVNPQLEVLAGDEAVISHRGRTILSLKAPEGFTTKVVKPREREPGPGWYSPGFGSLEAATVISFEGQLDSSRTARTIISLGN